MTIVAGTLAERCQMAAYLCYSIVLAGFVYPVVRLLERCSFRYLQALLCTLSHGAESSLMFL